MWFLGFTVGSCAFSAGRSFSHYRVRTAFRCLVVLLTLLAESSMSGEIRPGPGWSEVRVCVVEEANGRPVPGARLEHLCTISPYYGHAFVADTNGVAKVMIFRTWVALSAAGGLGLTNRLFIGGTNEVARFCTNAVIRLKPSTK